MNVHNTSFDKAINNKILNTADLKSMVVWNNIDKNKWNSDEVQVQKEKDDTRGRPLITRIKPSNRKMPWKEGKFNGLCG